MLEPAWNARYIVSSNIPYMESEIERIPVAKFWQKFFKAQQSFGASFLFQTIVQLAHTSGDNELRTFEEGKKTV